MVIKRRHTAANVAPALRTLLTQFNAAFPNRLKTTVGHDADGIWPSAAHTAANPNSDHESGNALDIDDDLSGSQSPPQVTPEMARTVSRDPRCNYTIHDRVIYRDGVGKSYTGSNPHTGHMHVSVYESKRRDAGQWDIGVKKPVSTPTYRYCVAWTETLELREAIEKACADRFVAFVSDGPVIVFHASLPTKVKEIEAIIDGTSGMHRFNGMPVAGGTHTYMGVATDQVHLWESASSLVDADRLARYQAIVSIVNG